METSTRDHANSNWQVQLKPDCDKRVSDVMPRFYFHLFNDENVPDKEGEICRNPAAAIEAATGMARDMAAVSVRNGHLTLHHRIEVADEDGNIVANLRYGDVIALSE